MPIHVDNLGNIPLSVTDVVGIDKVCSLVGFQIFSINIVSVKFNSLHEVLMSLLRSVGKAPICMVYMVFLVALKMCRYASWFWCPGVK